MFSVKTPRLKVSSNSTRTFLLESETFLNLPVDLLTDNKLVPILIKICDVVFQQLIELFFLIYDASFE